MVAAKLARSASSKTRTGALPPSSRWTFFTVSAAARMMCLPVAVPPVSETMSTPGCAASAAPVLRPPPVTTLRTPGGRMSCGDLAQQHASQRRFGRWLEYHGVARGQRRAELPAGQSHRVVPRHDSGHHAEGLAAGQAGDAGFVLRRRGSCHRAAPRRRRTCTCRRPELISPRASASGLPTSRASSSANSSMRRSITSAMRQQRRGPVPRCRRRPAGRGPAGGLYCGVDPAGAPRSGMVPIACPLAGSTMVRPSPAVYGFPSTTGTREERSMFVCLPAVKGGLGVRGGQLPRR